MMTTAAPPRPRGAGRYLALDGLRAVAILLVLSSHLQASPGYPALPSWYWHLGDFGNLGVRLFFVLSGFIITHLLVREQQRTGRASLAGFYRRRAYRILPPLIVFLLAMAALRAAGVVDFWGSHWLLSLVFLANVSHDAHWTLGHLWSLAVEEQFYLLWPVIFVGLGRRGAIAAALLAAVVGPAARLILSPGITDSIGFLQNVDAIGTGCLAALALGTAAGTRWTAIARRAPAWGWLLLIVIANLDDFPTVLRVTVAFPLVHLFVASLVLKVVDGASRDWSIRLLAAPAVVWVGTISYSLYLWQQPFMDATGLAARLGFPLNLLAAVGCATASLYLVERPALRRRLRLDAVIPGA